MTGNERQGPRRVILAISSDRAQVYFFTEYLVTLYLGERPETIRVMSRGDRGGLMPLLVLTDVPPPGIEVCQGKECFERYGSRLKFLDGCEDISSGLLRISEIRVLRGTPSETSLKISFLRVDVLRSYSTLHKVVRCLLNANALEGVVIFPVKGKALNLTVSRVLEALNSNLRDRDRGGVPWLIIGAYNVNNIPLVADCEGIGDCLGKYVEENIDEGFPQTKGDLIGVFYQSSAEFMAGAALSYMLYKDNPLRVPVWGFACYDVRKGDALDMLSELVFWARPKRSKVGRDADREVAARWVVRQISTHLCPRGREGFEGSEEEIRVLLEVDLLKLPGLPPPDSNITNFKGISIVGPKLFRSDFGFPEDAFDEMLSQIPRKGFFDLLYNLKNLITELRDAIFLRERGDPGKEIFEVWKELTDFYRDYISMLPGAENSDCLKLSKLNAKVFEGTEHGYLNCPVSRGVHITYLNGTPGELPCLHSEVKREASGGNPPDGEASSFKGRMVKVYACFDEHGPGSLVKLLQSMLVHEKDRVKCKYPLINFVTLRSTMCPFGNMLLEFAGNLNFEFRTLSTSDDVIAPNQLLMIGPPDLLEDLTREGSPLGRLVRGGYCEYGDSNENYRIFRRCNAEGKYLPFCDYVKGCPFSRFDISINWSRRDDGDAPAEDGSEGER